MKKHLGILCWTLLGAPADAPAQVIYAGPPALHVVRCGAGDATLRGVVRDPQTGHTMPGGLVILGKPRCAVEPDHRGRFEFAGLPEGPVTIEFTSATASAPPVLVHVRARVTTTTVPATAGGIVAHCRASRDCRHWLAAHAAPMTESQQRDFVVLRTGAMLGWWVFERAVGWDLCLPPGTDAVVRGELQRIYPPTHTYTECVRMARAQLFRPRALGVAAFGVDLLTLDETDRTHHVAIATNWAGGWGWGATWLCRFEQRRRTWELVSCHLDSVQ